MRCPVLSRVLMLLALLALLAPLAGCGKDKKSPTQPGDVNATIEEANRILADLLYAQIHAPNDPQRPSDVNLDAAYEKFQEALRQDPANPSANFGVAVLGTLSLTQDPEVNAAFDEWKAYVDAHRTPFEVPAPRPAPTLGVPLGLRGGTAALRLPFALAPATVTALAHPRFVAADPQLARAQNILRQRALPRLGEAIARLDVVVGDPRYVFTVTPRMQGDESESPVEVDHTDFLALRSACQLLAALCDMAVAYDLNFAAYDSVTLVANLSQGSNWMRLTPDGGARLQEAQRRLRAASFGVDSTIVSLLAETDDQSDDVIKIGPDPAERARLEALHDDMATFRGAIGGRWTRTEDWDDNPGTPPVALTFDLDRYFQQPPADWKALLPGYTVSTERRAARTNEHFAFGQDTLDVDVAVAGYVSASYFYAVWQTGSGLDSTTYSYGPDWMVSALRALARQRAAELVNLPDWTGAVSVNVSHEGYLEAGPHRPAFVQYSQYWTTAPTWVVVPVITWNATSFAQWAWPDPSLGGILPDLGSTSQLLGVFGITESRWSRRNVLDWTRPGGYSSAAVSGRVP